MRPWYRIHRSTLGVLAVVIAWLVFVNIPGDRILIDSHRFHHGWPYFYFERDGSERSFWSFAGTSTRFNVGPLMLNVLAAFCIAALVAFACELWIRRNGRLVRFGLKSMFAITTAFAVLMGLVIQEVHQCHRQNQTLHELAALGTVTTTRHLRKYDWFRSVFGSDSDGTVARVEVVAAQPTEGPLPDLSALRQVYYLRIENVAMTPTDVDRLAGLPKLEYLSVRLSSFRAKDAPGLRALTALPKLGYLGLEGDTFSDDTLAYVSGDTQIGTLRVTSSKVTDKGLRRLSELRSLEYLFLNAAVIRANNCSVLCGLPNLRLLRFVGNKLNTQDEEKLGALWPNAEIRTGILADTGEKFINIERDLPRDEFVDQSSLDQ